MYSISQKAPPIMHKVTYSKGQVIFREAAAKNLLAASRDRTAQANE